MTHEAINQVLLLVFLGAGLVWVSPKAPSPFSLIINIIGWFMIFVAAFDVLSYLIGLVV